MGYYDPHPWIVPRRPLAMVGFYASGTDLVASGLAMRTGLPYLELEHMVEHEVGMSSSRFVLENGEVAYRKREKGMLKKALAGTPPAVIALTEGALIDPECQRMVKARADLIYLRRELEDSFARLCEVLEREPGRHHQFMFGPPEDPSDLVPLLELRAAGYTGADYILDATGVGTSRLSSKILADILPTLAH